MPLPDAVLAVDLGKTSCRVRISVDGATIGEAVGTGAPGLAERDGAALSFGAITEATGRLPSDVLGRVRSIGIGAAGVAASAGATGDLIERMRARFRAPVAVLTDALTAHAGAFRGGAGAILIAGTGAVVFVVTDGGSPRQIDGWGPWLGDEGSGQWIGRHGLRAAMRAYDGRGEPTSLQSDAHVLADGIEHLPRWVSEAGAPARQLGSFAGAVLSRAEQGDPVASAIVQDAVAALAKACLAAETPTVCTAGGLTGSAYFREQLHSALDAAGLRVVPPLGDPLDGAALIATTTSSPYEERVIRG